GDEGDLARQTTHSCPLASRFSERSLAEAAVHEPRATQAVRLTCIFFHAGDGSRARAGPIIGRTFECRTTLSSPEYTNSAPRTAQMGSSCSRKRSIHQLSGEQQACGVSGH